MTADEAGRLRSAVIEARKLTERWYEMVCEGRLDADVASVMTAQARVIDSMSRVIEDVLDERGSK